MQFISLAETKVSPLVFPFCGFAEGLLFTCLWLDKPQLDSLPIIGQIRQVIIERLTRLKSITNISNPFRANFTILSEEMTSIIHQADPGFHVHTHVSSQPQSLNLPLLVNFPLP